MGSGTFNKILVFLATVAIYHAPLSGSPKLRRERKSVSPTEPEPENLGHLKNVQSEVVILASSVESGPNSHYIISHSIAMQSKTISDMLEETDSRDQIMIPYPIEVIQFVTQLQLFLNHADQETKKTLKFDANMPLSIEVAYFLEFKEVTDVLIESLKHVSYDPNNLFEIFVQLNQKHIPDILEQVAYIIFKKAFPFDSHGCSNKSLVRIIDQENPVKEAKNFLRYIKGQRYQSDENENTSARDFMRLTKSLQYAYKINAQLYEINTDCESSTMTRNVVIKDALGAFFKFNRYEQSTIIEISHTFPTGDLFDFLIWELNSKQLFQICDILRNSSIFEHVAKKLVLKKFTEKAAEQPHEPNKGLHCPLRRHLEPLLELSNEAFFLEFYRENTPFISNFLQLSNKILEKTRLHFAKMKFQPYYTMICEQSDMKNIDLSYTNMDDLALLSGLHHVEHLNLQVNMIRSFVGFPWLMFQLRHLRLSSNNITSFVGLPGSLFRLRTLKLDHNQIKNFVGLSEKLTALHTLDLSHNLFEKSDALPDELTISTLNLNENPITNWSKTIEEVQRIKEDFEAVKFWDEMLNAM